jgi:RNA 3'-terminal phosphate cyclase-like protein
VSASRGVLNDFLPDVWIYSDFYKGKQTSESPGYALNLVAETNSNNYFSIDIAFDEEN